MLYRGWAGEHQVCRDSRSCLSLCRTMSASIVWFRRDLRLADNPALNAALRLNAPLALLFIYAPEEEGEWSPGGASRWWLHHSLSSLQREIEALGGRLIVRAGSSEEVLKEVIAETSATHLFWNRLYEPAIISRDTRLKEELSRLLKVESFNSALLFEPWEISNQSGKPFQVFTPFWRACLKDFVPEKPLPAPASFDTVSSLKSLSVDELQLLPTIPWDTQFYENWKPGESSAFNALREFLNKAVGDYSDLRDIPSVRGTSRLSPHLHFGEISPRQIWHETESALRQKGGAITEKGAEHFLREVGWREFAHHLLFHFPHTPSAPLRENFEGFPWESDPEILSRWQRGMTGYPIVDAGMRELWHTGWMHNRVRMIVSSFLVKHLLHSWLDGAKWFWDTLVDASLASNTLGWQWSGGCGADAAPYFRIFNPVTQGEKFDPEGIYVRRWVPEVSALPDNYIFKPWEAPQAVLDRAGVVLGKTYPQPIVDHRFSRERALRAFDQVKR